MEWADKIVMQTPLSELWNGNGLIPSKRNRCLKKIEVKEMLKQGLIQFVVANIGMPLAWIQLSDYYTFWKKNVANNLSQENEIALEDFSDEYAFIASEWTSEQQPPIILLEKIH